MKNSFGWLKKLLRVLPPRWIKFQRERERELKGLPIGNLTSQVFANIYLNKLDWFISKKLRVKNYFRYTDDFIIVHRDVKYLKDALINIDYFLRRELDLELHPQKVQIRKLSQGIDFLGYIVLPRYIILRTKTKKRMFKKMRMKRNLLDGGLINKETFNQSRQSYLGLLKHCNGHKISNILKFIWKPIFIDRNIVMRHASASPWFIPKTSYNK